MFAAYCEDKFLGSDEYEPTAIVMMSLSLVQTKKDRPKHSVVEAETGELVLEAWIDKENCTNLTRHKPLSCPNPFK